MSLRPTNRLFLCAAVAALTLPFFAYAKEGDPAAWAPRGALIYVGVPDVQQFWKNLELTTGFKAMKDPELKQLPNRFMLMANFADKFREQLAKTLEIPADQLKSPFAGPLAFYVLPPASADDKGEPIVVAGVGDADLLKNYYDKAVKKLRDSASKYESETVGSYKVDIFAFDKKANKDQDGDAAKSDEMSDNDDDADDDQNGAESMAEQMLAQVFSTKSLPPKLAACIAGERLIIAATKEQVQDALRRERGGESLATSDEYKVFERQFKSKADVRMLVNIRKLIEIGLEKDEESARKTADAMGVKSFRNLYAQVTIDGKTYDSKLEALLEMTGERTGLAKILSLKNRPAALPSTAGAETCMTFSANLVVSDLLDEVERIIRQSDPAEADQMHSAMSAVPMGENAKVDLRKELFDQLREPLALSVGFTKPYDLSSARAVLSIGHKSKDAIDRFMAKVSEAMPGTLTDRDLRGVHVYDTPFKMSVAATSDSVLAGSSAAIDTAVVGGAEGGLANDANYKRAAEFLPKEASMMFYFDGRRMLDAMLEVAKDRETLMMSAMSNPANMFAAGMAESYGEIKPEQREKARKLLDYATISIGAVTTTDDGLRFTMVALPAKP